MQVFDPFYEASAARLRDTAAAALPVVEAAHRRRMQAHDDYVTALDKFATLAADVRYQRLLQSNGASNHAAEAEIAFEAARQALIAAHLHANHLEVR